MRLFFKLFRLENPPKNKGFTMIELMISVCTVGILAIIAIPVYQEYAVRARVTEAFSLVHNAKIAVVQEASVAGSLQALNHKQVSYQYDGQSKYVEKIEIGPKGVITMTFGPQGIGGNPSMNGKAILLVPTQAQDGKFVWQCTMESTAHHKYVPRHCRQIAAKNNNRGRLAVAKAKAKIDATVWRGLVSITD